MEYRDLGQTGMRVSEISLGTWAFGGDWGTVGEDDAYAALNRAIDLGVNFIDTALVYGDGHSEQLVGRTVRNRTETVHVATKLNRAHLVAGRRALLLPCLAAAEPDAERHVPAQHHVTRSS